MLNLCRWVKPQQTLPALVARAICVLASILALSACSKTGSLNPDLLNITVGVDLFEVAGNNQIGTPNQDFPSPLIVQALDPISGNPDSNLSISFTEVTSTGAQILSPFVTTDSNGLAQTVVKAPNGSNSQILIRAEVVGTNITSEFSLNTLSTVPSYHFVINTTHNLNETAGVPFQFTLTAVDSSNAIDSSISGKYTLGWSVLTNHAWAYSALSVNSPSVSDYSIPGSSTSCTFIAGTCTLSTFYTLTDTRQSTAVWVSETTGALAAGSATIKVLPATATSTAPNYLVIANATGGPLSSATAYSNPIIATINSPTFPFVAAITDAYGNYITNAPSSTTWATSAQSPAGVLSSHLSATTGTSITLTPTVTGSGTLTATALNSVSSFPSSLTTNYTADVEPGTPTQLVLSTPATSITAGVPISLSLTLKDENNNVITSSAGTGTFSTVITMNQSTFTPDISRGCNRVEVGGDNTYLSPVVCGNRTANLAFSQGVLTTPLAVSFNYAYENYSTAQTITLTTTLASGNSLTASPTPTYTPHIGSASRLELHRSNTAGTFLFNEQTFETASPTWTDTAGTAPATLYAVLTDTAGNYISSPATVNWTAGGALATEFSPTAGTASSTYTPTVSGSGTLTLYDTASGVSTTYTSTTTTEPLDHFALAISDGTHVANTVSVTAGLTFTLTAQDTYNNTVGFNGSVPLTITTNGAITSPMGTAVNLPTSGTYTFSSGQLSLTTVSGNPIRVPNAGSAVTLSVSYTNTTSGTTYYSLPSGSSGPASATTLTTLTLLDGAPQYLQILSALSNEGYNYTQTPLTIPAGNSPATLSFPYNSTQTFYLNTYDSEGNFINSTNAGTWSWSNGSIGSLSANPSASTTLTPTTAGTGTLSVTYSGLTATTNTVTVSVPGTVPTKLVLTTQHAGTETAGDAFSVTINAEDSGNNVVSTYSGAKTIAFGVAGGSTPTSQGDTFTVPSSASFTFTNGTVTIPSALSPPFNLFNSTLTPTLQASISTDNLSGASSAITVEPNTPARLAITSSAQNITAGSCSAAAITVQSEDTYGNIATTTTSATITLSSSSGLGSFYSSSNCSAPTTGTATISAASSSTQIYYKDPSVGSPVLTASTSNWVSATQTETIVLGPASQLAFSVEPSATATAGAAFATQPTVAIEDTYGNVISSAVDSVTLAAYIDSGCATLVTAGTLSAASNPLTANGTTGTSAFSGLNFTKAQTIYLKATSFTGTVTLTSACSTAVNIVPAALNKLTFSTQPSTTATAGATFATEPVVQLLDTYGNVLTTSTAPITLAAFTNSTCTTAATGTFGVTTNPVAASGGTASFAGVNYDPPGTIFLQASNGTATVCSNAIAITSTTISPTLSTLTVSPNSVAANGATNATITVTLKDTYGNLATGQTITLTSNRGILDSQVSPPTTTNNAGVAVFNVNSSLAGTSVFTAASGTVTLSTQANVLFLGSTPSLDYQASLAASGTSQGINAPITTSWFNLANNGSSNNLTLNNFISPWSGSTTVGVPYALAFNGSNSYLSGIGTTLNNDSDVTLEVWAQPTKLPTATPSPPALGSVLMSNGYPLPGSTASPAPTPAGMTLRQSAIYPGKMQLTIGGGSYVDEVIADAPVGFWRLDETSGTSANDYSGYGNTGTYAGGYTQGQSSALTGDAATSTHFDGSSGNVNFGNTSSFDFGQNSFTLEAWANLAVSNKGTILSNTSFIGSGFLMNTTGGFGCGLMGTSTAESLYIYGPLTTNTWHHLVCVLNATAQTLTAYVDGAIESVIKESGSCGSVTSNILNFTFASCSTASANHAVNTTIGSWKGSSFFFPGSIANVAIYNTALSAQRVAAHYAAANRSTCLTSNALTNGAWHLFDGTFASATSTLSLFMDGKQQCSITNNQAAYTGASNSSAFNVGADSTAGSAWAGLISDIRAYASALSPTAISKNFVATAQRGFPSSAVMWLKADTGTMNGSVPATSGASVSTWVDQSGYTGANHGNATGGTSPTYSANASNGYPALSFNGTSQYLVGPSVFPTSADYSIIAVPSFSNLTNTNNIISASDTGHAFFLNGTAYLNLYQNGSFATSTIPVTTSTFYVLSSTYQQSNSAGTVFVNGAQAGSGTASSSNTNNTIYIGDDTTGAYTLAGSMTEAFVFSSALSTSARQFVESYLTQKYNIISSAYQLAFTSEPTASQTAGQTLLNSTSAPAIVVTVEDRNGNTVSTYSSPITLAISSSTLNGTTVLTPANGTVTFSNLVADTAGTYTLTATSGTLIGATSSSFIVNASSTATQLAFIDEPAASTTEAASIPGTSGNIVVAIQDANGNVVTSGTSASATITIAIDNNPSTGVLSGTATIVASSGLATFSNLNVNLAGIGYTFVATSTGLTSAVSSAFNIVAGAANKLAFSVEPPSTAVAGTAGTFPVAVQVEDANGNAITSAADAISLTAYTDPACSVLASGSISAGTSTTNPTTSSNTTGVATFTNIYYNGAGSLYIQASSPTVTNPVCSSLVQITSASAYQLSFSGAGAIEPSNTTAGLTMATVQVAVLDAYGNLVTSGSAASATITLAFGTNTVFGTLSGTATVAAGTGVASFTNLSINLAATNYTFTATAGGLLGATSSTFTIYPGGASQLAFGVQPSNGFVSPNFLPQFTVNIEDTEGNIVTSSTAAVTIALTTNPTSATFTTTTNPVNAVAGVATFVNNLKINTVGTGYILTATSPGLAPISSNAFQVTNITPSASLSSAIATPYTVYANNSTNNGVNTNTVTVTLKDSYGNLLPSGVDVTLTAASSNTVSITSATNNNIGYTNSSGVAQFYYSASSAGVATFTITSNGVTLNNTPSVVFVGAQPDLDYEAPFAAGGLSAGTNSSPVVTTWKDMTQIFTTNDASLNSFIPNSTDGWSGSGTTTSPYALTFDGSTHSSYVNMGTSNNSSSSGTLSTWYNPSVPTSSGTVIVGNGDTSDRGLIIEQSPLNSGGVEVHTGYRSYTDEVMADAPVGYWRLGEINSTTATDYSGNGNTGTYNGTYTQGQPGALPGDINTSTSFNSSGYVKAATTALPSGTAARTIEAWVNPTSLPPPAGFTSTCAVWYGSQTTSEGQGLCFYNNSGTQMFDYDGYADDAMWTNTAVSTNAWSHLVATFDGTNARMYANGIPVGSATPKPSWNTVLNSSLGIQIGNAVWGPQYFPGYIQDVAVYNTALSASRIAAHYAARNRTVCRSASTLPANVWNHLTGAFNGSTNSLSLFVNGVQECTVTNASAAAFNGSTNAIVAGALNNAGSMSQFFSGSIAAIRAFGSALTQSLTETLVGQTYSNYTPAPTETAGPAYNNLVLWLRADKGVTTSGSNVASWTDQSPLANGNSTPVPASSPTIIPNAINGLPAIGFNGSSAYLNGPSVFPTPSATSGSYSILAVVNIANTTNPNHILSGQGSSTHAFYFNGLNYPRLYQGAFFAGTSATATNQVTTSGYNIISADVSWNNATTTYTGSTYVNGALGQTTTATTKNADTSIQIGGDNNANFLDGSIAEILLYNTALSNSERHRIEDYLFSKYNLSPLSTPAAIAVYPAVSTATAGNAISVVVQPQDNYGNSMAGFNGTITFSSSDSQYSVSGGNTYTFVPSTDKGVHTFTVTFKTEGNQTLTASSGGPISGSPITGTSSTVTVSPNNLSTSSQLTITTGGTNLGSTGGVLVGQSATITFTAEDSYGNVISSYAGPVTLTASGGTSTGTLSNASPMTNNSNGTFTSTYAGTSTGNSGSTDLGGSPDAGAGNGTYQTLTASNAGNNFTALIQVLDTTPTLTPFTASTSGNTYTYSSDGDNVTSGSATSIGDFTNPFISQGSPVTLFNSTSPDPVKSVSITSCTYSTLGLSTSDPNYASSANCGTLSSLVTGTSGTIYATPLATPTSAASSQSINWIPTSTQRGAFQFNVTASDGVKNTSSTFTAIVRDSDSGSGINLSGNILLYHMDGSGTITSGQAITDSSGNGYNGTANGTGLSYVNGINTTSDQAITFSSSSYISSSTAGALSAYPMTILAWVNTTQSATGAGIINKTSSSTNGWRLYLTSGTPCLTYAQSSSNYVSTSGTCSSTTVNDGNWHHLAAVVNSDGEAIYVDGVTSGITSWTGTAGAPTSTAALLIGNDTAGTYFTGSLAEVAVYSRALSTAEIAGAFSTHNTLSLLDANFSQDASGVTTPSAPYATGTTASSWLNLLPNGPTGEFGGSCTWEGTGRSSTAAVDPYSISFPGTASNSLTAGTAISSSITKVALETWIKPASATSAGAVIASNNNAGSATAGISLRQSTYPTGRAELAIGQKYYSYQDLILSDAPITFWRLSEGSGTTATDLSAYGNNGTYNGGYTLSQTGPLTAGGDNSTSVLLDGTSGYILGSQTVNIALASVEAWIYPTAYPTGTNGELVGFINGEGSTIYDKDLFLDTSGYLYFYSFVTSGATTSAPSSPIPLNQWSHVVGTANGTTMYTYINGVQVGSVAFGTTATNYTSPNIVVGGQSTGIPFYGHSIRIADVAIYNYALSQAQISNHYNAGAALYSVPYPGNAVLADKPIGYWRLNETQGNIAYDSSGYGNNGTYNGTYTLGQAGALTAGGDQSNSTLFDGSSAYVEALAPTSIPTGAAARTIEAWIKPTSLPSSGQNCIASYGTNATGQGQGLCIKNTSINYLGYGSNAAWTYTTSTSGWTHAVATYDGTNALVYMNGATIGSAIGISWNTQNPNGLFTIGNSNWSGNPLYPGNIAEVAIYNYALSPTQITHHYNSGKGTAWWLCQSQTQLSSSNWNFFSGLWDGTNAKLYTNGQLECSVQPSTTYSSATYNGYSGAGTNLQVAASPAGSSYWDGFLNLLKVLGTSDGVTNPLPSTVPQSDFAATANRFRQQPIENIVADSSLILHFDAANAQQGTMPYTSTASTPYTWFDLSASGLNASLGDGTNSTFNSGSSGTFVTNMNWNTSAPYALNNTSGLYAGEINNTASIFSTITTGLTVEAWINVLTPGNEKIIYTNLNAVTGGGFVMGIYEDGSFCTGQFRNYDEIWVGGSATHYQNNGACAPLNTWTHLAMTFQAGASSGTFTSYKNGSSDVSQSTVSGNISSGLMNPPAFGGIQGQIAIFRIYNRALSATEINQNCNAQKSRFSGATCAAP